jgi:hypothetical protein
MRLVVVGAVIAVLGLAMSLGGLVWGLAGGVWWPGPTLLNGVGWLILAAGVVLVVVGLVRRSRRGTSPHPRAGLADVQTVSSSETDGGPR